jgi:hypothetical protein
VIFSIGFSRCDRRAVHALHEGHGLLVRSRGDLHAEGSPKSGEGGVKTVGLVWIALLSLPQEEPSSQHWTIADLLDKVGPRVGRTFVYDRNLQLEKIEVSTPFLSDDLPKETLLRTLGKALQVSSLILVPPMRPEDSWSVHRASQGLKHPLRVLGSSEEIPSDYGMYTRVYVLKHAAPKDLYASLINRITFPQGIQAFPKISMLVVTDYASNLKTLDIIIALVDRPSDVKDEPESKPAEPGPEKESNKSDPGKFKTRKIHSSASREVWLMDPKGIKWALENFESEMKKNVTFSPTENGLRITKINAGSIGIARGLKKNDVIRSVNGHSMKSLADIKKMQDDPRNQHRRSMTIVIQRNGRNMVLEYRAQPSSEDR